MDGINQYCQKPHYIDVLKEFRGVTSFAVSHSAQTGIGSLPLVYFGTDEQKKKYLPKIAGGEWIPAYCLAESNAGSDALSIRTTAELTEDGKHYFLNGESLIRV